MAMDIPSSPIVIPQLLIGRHRDLVRRWKTIFRRAVRTGSWEQALGDQQWVSLDDCPGEFVVDGGPNALMKGDNVLLYLVGDMGNTHALDIVEKECGGDDYDLWRIYYVLRDLSFLGYDHFWFCLSRLATTMIWPCVAKDCGEYEAWCRAEAGSILKWWPILCSLDQRYYNIGRGYTPLTWRSWASTLHGELRGMGIALTYKPDDPVEAGMVIRHSLDAWDNEHPDQIALMEKMKYEAHNRTPWWYVKKSK